MWDSKRLLVLGIVGLVLSIAGYFAYEQRFTILMLKRMMIGMPDPHAAGGIIQELVKQIPEGRPVVVAAIQPKMGTSWMGHIIHQLVSHSAPIDGNRNLMLDSPYPEFSKILFNASLAEMKDPPYWEREPFASFPEGPVTIRTHLSMADLHKVGVTEEKGYKLLCVLRDPKDTILSMWRFVPTVVGIPYQKVAFSSIFTLLRLLGMLDKMFADYASFWQRRHHPNVHVVFFDDLKENRADTIRRLATFLDLKPPCTDEQIQTVIEQSSHKFMSSPTAGGRFNDDAGQVEHIMKVNGLTMADALVKFSDVGVVRKGGGKSGEGTEVLGESSVATIDALWERHVKAVTGFDTFKQMLESFRQEINAQN